MDNVQNCDSCINIRTIVTNLLTELTCWARSGDIMFFLLGTDKAKDLNRTSAYHDPEDHSKKTPWP
jgi:hypothetical protein